MGNIAWKLPPTEAELLEQAKESKLREINAAYTEALTPLIKTYPEIERMSWDKQQREAMVYQDWLDAGGAGTPPETLVLDNILAGRNAGSGTETLAELVGKVLSNAEQFIVAQQLTGKRHRLEKAIKAAGALDKVQAITW